MLNGVPNGWEKRKLGDFLTLKRGYDLPETRRVGGNFPVVSSSGITGYHNEKKADGPGIVTGRYGTLGEVHLIEGGYGPLNTALYVKDFKGNPVLFLLHLLESQISGLQSDTAAVPGLNRNVLHALNVPTPPKTLCNQFDEFATVNYQQIGILRLATKKLQTARDLLLPRLMNGEITV